MNYLTKFWNKAKHESWEGGKSFDGFDLKNGFSGFIYFSDEHWIECEINEDGLTTYDSYLDKNHEYMIDAFADYVQGIVRDNKQYIKDIEDTESSLMW